MTTFFRANQAKRAEVKLAQLKVSLHGINPAHAMIQAKLRQLDGRHDELELKELIQEQCGDCDPMFFKVRRRVEHAVRAANVCLGLIQR